MNATASATVAPIAFKASGMCLRGGLVFFAFWLGGELAGFGAGSRGETSALFVATGFVEGCWSGLSGSVAAAGSCEWAPRCPAPAPPR